MLLFLISNLYMQLVLSTPSADVKQILDRRGWIPSSASERVGGPGARRRLSRPRVALHPQDMRRVDHDRTAAESSVIVAMHSLRSTLQLLRRGPDDDLVDFHLGRLFDGVSDRARDRASRNSDFVEVAHILSGRFLRT